MAGLPDRTFERGQGCWNCINAQPPIERWFGKHKEGIRGQMLARATKLAVNSPQGENSEPVVRIRRSIELIDQAIAHSLVFACDKGITADGTPVGDFVASAFLCSRWSGRDGASLARSPDGRLDELPEELRDRVDGSGPLDVADLIKKAQGDTP